MPAAPFIIPAVGAGISGYSAYQNAKAARRAGAAQERLLGEQTTSARMSREAGTGLLQAGMPATQSALQYYATLLRGNRAQMAQATAGPMRAITDVYRGAEKSLERQGVRGGERATAQAELSRDRAAAIAGLTTGVQGNAASALADIGGNLIGQGMTGLSGAAGQFGAAAQQYGTQASGFREAGRDDMKGFGKSLGELLQIALNRRGATSPT